MRGSNAFSSYPSCRRRRRHHDPENSAAMLNRSPQGRERIGRAPQGRRPDHVDGFYRLGLMIRRTFSMCPSLRVASRAALTRHDIHAYIHQMPDEFKAAAPMARPHHHPRRLQQAASCADCLHALTERRSVATSDEASDAILRGREGVKAVAHAEYLDQAKCDGS